MDEPWIPPPPGDKSDFAAKGGSVEFIAGISACLSISSLLLACRVYTRLCLIKRHGAEDVTIILAWLFMIAYLSNGFPLRDSGLGNHAWNVPKHKIPSFIYLTNVGSILFDLACAFVKISIVSQYRNIFLPQSKRSFMWWSTWLMTAIIIIFYIYAIFANIFACIPREKLWRPSTPGRCIDTAGYLDVGSFNVATDLILLLMPQYSIWKLNLPVRSRFSLGLVFFVGVAALVASSVRLYFAKLLETSPDTTYLALKNAAWGLVEMTCGLACVCLPVLPRFFKSLKRNSTFHDTWTSTSRSAASRQQQSRRKSTLATSSRQGDTRSWPRVPTRPDSSTESQDFFALDRIESVRRDDEYRHTGGGILKTVQIDVETQVESEVLPARPRGW